MNVAENEIVKFFIDAGADLKGANKIGLIKTTQIKAWFDAAKIGNLELIKYLVAEGIDIDVSDSEFGSTALIMASRYGYTDIVEFLVSVGADLNATMEYSWTALMWASSEGYTEIVEHLVNAGAELNVVNNEGDTALMWASNEGHIEIVGAISQCWCRC